MLENQVHVKAFSFENNIEPGTFHNWKKKYTNATVKPVKHLRGFLTLQITRPAVVSEPLLFVEVKEIKIYQWVNAAYFSLVAMRYLYQ